MAAILELKCAAHGEFESTEFACPHGCPKRFVVQEFRTPNAIHDGTTAYTDRTLRGLADSVGLTDMRNDKDGSSVMANQRNTGTRGPDFSPRWVDIPHASPGWSQRQEQSPIVTPEQVGQPGLQAANIVDEFKKQGIHLPGPTLAASEKAGLLVGRASRESLE
jgi:hypothetical protein